MVHGVDVLATEIPKVCSATATALMSASTTTLEASTAGLSTAAGLPGSVARYVLGVARRLNDRLVARTLSRVYAQTEWILFSLLHIIILLTITAPLALQLWKELPIPVLPLLHLSLIQPLLRPRGAHQLGSWAIGVVLSLACYALLVTGSARDVPQPYAVLCLFLVGPVLLPFCTATPLHESRVCWSLLGLGWRFPDSVWVRGLVLRLGLSLAAFACTRNTVLLVLVAVIQFTVSLGLAVALDAMPWYVWESSPSQPPMHPVALARAVVADLDSNGPASVVHAHVPLAAQLGARAVVAVSDAYREAAGVLCGGGVDHVSRAVYDEAVAPLPQDRVLEARVCLSDKWWGRNPPPYDALNCTCLARPAPTPAVPLTLAGSPVDPILYSSCDINVAFCVWGRHYPAITEPDLSYVVTVQ